MSSPNAITPYEIETLKILVELAEEIAATSEIRKIQAQKPTSLARVGDLVRVGADIIGVLHDKTHSGEEARFVIEFVRGAVYHWRAPEKEARSGK